MNEDMYLQKRLAIYPKGVYDRSGIYEREVFEEWNADRNKNRARSRARIKNR